MNDWKCKLISHWHSTAGLKPFLAGENTSVLIILATTVYMHVILITINILSYIWGES